MRTNVAASAILLLLAACAATGYKELKHQDDHIISLGTEDYILAIFYDAKKQPKLAKPLKSVMEKLTDSTPVKINNVLLELIDTHALPFFDEHYELDGKPAARLFVRSQMINNAQLSEHIAQLGARGADEAKVVDEVVRWIDSAIGGISVHVDNIGAFRELVARDKVVGLYTGAEGPNFVRFFRVARKNIDFSFAHTFDEKLAASIYKEYGQTAPEGDTFAVVRTAHGVNEFDPSPLVPFADFDERALTEFIEFERYDKLRPASQTRNIFQKLFLKYQPLLIHAGDAASEKLAVFSEAVKQLPKNMIYAHADPESSDASPYHQLFMQAGEALMPDSIHILHSGVDQKIRITPYKGPLSAQGIKDFASRFMSEQADFFKNARNYLYDKVDTLTGHEKKDDKKESVDTEL